MEQNFKPLPPLSRVQELLYLDEAGYLRWRVNRRRIKAGTLAGTRKGKPGDGSVTIDGEPYRAGRLISLLKNGVPPTERVLTGAPLGRRYLRGSGYGLP